MLKIQRQECVTLDDPPVLIPGIDCPETDCHFVPVQKCRMKQPGCLVEECKTYPQTQCHFAPFEVCPENHEVIPRYATTINPNEYSNITIISEMRKETGPELPASPLRRFLRQMLSDGGQEMPGSFKARMPERTAVKGQM